MINKKNSNRTKLDKISKITFVYIIVKNKMFEWKYNAKIRWIHFNVTIVSLDQKLYYLVYSIINSNEV